MSKGVYPRPSSNNTSRKIKWLQNAQKQNIETKIFISNKIIDKSLLIGKSALLYSGGKDSEVLLTLLLEKIPDLLIIYNNTTLCEQKIIDFIRDRTKNLNFIETTAQDPILMWQTKGYYPILSKRGFTKYKKKYPDLKVSPVQCCYQLKEIYANKILKDNNIKVVFWGNRASESNRRKLTFADNGFLFKPKKYPWYQAYPLQHWTTEDIMKFLKAKCLNYPINKDLENGCICCGTDLTFKKNNLLSLFQKDKKKWEFYMKNGFAKQILIAKGIDINKIDIDDIITNKPDYLLRI
jgi:3'-phosphoadenosine 5'-phosphosulfate sulfotransferase (PAPS reductase)/FAD synthetase